MALFPAIEPDLRGYDLGTFSSSRMASATGAGVRFLHSTAKLGHVLTLDFKGLTETEMALIRAHHTAQAGEHRSFPLPDVIWLAHTTTTDVVPTNSRWVYVSPPDENAQDGALYSPRVTLRNVGIEPGLTTE